jgi:hypothetical protein
MQDLRFLILGSDSDAVAAEDYDVYDDNTNYARR